MPGAESTRVPSRSKTTASSGRGVDELGLRVGGDVVRVVGGMMGDEVGGDADEVLGVDVVQSAIAHDGGGQAMKRFADGIGDETDLPVLMRAEDAERAQLDGIG